ncbi:MAG: N-acetylmuramoyl-L-alanine amidase [Defluviitaleaceae bacterium]|nr:N-acetylmuramoyl-L-alanine amidase [Defluviitaleaceae bacterium]
MKKLRYIALLALVFLSTFAGAASKKVIVIDPGHGGWDPGKISSEGHKEADINLAIAKKLQFYLEHGGAVTFLTRSGDEALANKKRADLAARVAFVSDFDADLFISIHQNAFEQPSVRGAQVFYYEDSIEGEALADAIQKSIQTIADKDNKMSIKGGTSYFILKESSSPAVIVECGFLTNQRDLENLITDEYQEKLAWSIYLGIVDYFDLKNGDISP